MGLLTGEATGRFELPPGAMDVANMTEEEKIQLAVEYGMQPDLSPYHRDLLESMRSQGKLKLVG